MKQPVENLQLSLDDKLLEGDWDHKLLNQLNITDKAELSLKTSTSTGAQIKEVRNTVSKPSCF